MSAGDLCDFLKFGKFLENVCITEKMSQYMETGVCTQHYSMNKPLISIIKPDLSNMKNFIYKERGSRNLLFNTLWNPK